MTYDDAAVERVARFLGSRYLELNRSDLCADDFFRPGCNSLARSTWEQDAREIIALLTPPPDPV